MKNIIQIILRLLSKRILNKYHPEVIGITGSVGKTGAKEAIFTVLNGKFRVRKNIKNYNNELGVPLTIIGLESPGSAISGWLKVFLKANSLLIREDINYPKILILEMAADRPGDIGYLTEMVKCDIAIITSIGDSHLENFKTIENIKEEKLTIIRKMKENGRAILNIDDVKLRNLKEKVKIFTYGMNESADARAKELKIKLPLDAGLKEDFGLSFKLINKGAFAPVFLPGIISLGGAYAALAGAAAGLLKGMNLVEISQALKNYQAPNGRLKILSGIKKTIIIDDTYNASPLSSILALNALKNIKKSRGSKKYAVLGDMMELGSASVSGHEEVGRAAAKNKIDELIVVGERSRDIARGAKAAGMKRDNIFHFATTDEAHIFIQERIKSGDIILVKGSQAARMEKIVKEIMADPLRADELLVRQGKEWERK